MVYLYNLLFYKPLLNILIVFYQTIAFQDLGLAIIFLTILIRLILFPVFQHGVHYQTKMQQLQPKLKQLQAEHKGDLEKQSQAMMALYKEHNINPFSGFLMLLIQLPILIALYHIFLSASGPEILQNLYPFIHAPAQFQPYFLGLINLREANILLVGLAAIAQYFQGSLALAKNPPGQGQSAAEKMSRRMVWIAPLITIFIFMRLPAAVSLYWVISSSFSVLQQIIINRKLNDGKLGNIS